MGLHVLAVDVADDKLNLATHMGADLVVNAANEDPIAFAQQMIKGAHGALVTAVSATAFSQALRMLRRKGVISLNGLPPGDFPLPIFDVVLKRITVRGSIVGTRKDLEEALDFAAEGKVHAHVHPSRLEDVNTVFERMRQGGIDGRIVLDLQ
jgi:propanol-preferring alcohol dehydrogenase